MQWILIGYLFLFIHRPFEFTLQQLSHFSWHVFARRNNKAVHIQMNARQSRDRRKQHRTAMCRYALGNDPIQKRQVAGKIRSRGRQ